MSLPQKNTGMFDRMLRVVARIPKGRVTTYGDIAYAAGYPGAARQVAWALHASRGLPWQRVLGAGGKILLTGEAGMEQRFRLENEGVSFVGLRVNMKQHHFSFVRRTKRPSSPTRKGTQTHPPRQRRS